CSCGEPSGSRRLIYATTPYQIDNGFKGMQRGAMSTKVSTAMQLLATMTPLSSTRVATATLV
ncbi:MAG: hypothetical protein RSE32_02740, partial [Comamonas sp.]|uniref:hypothetical protein n=1 Tax=Comamonas sp. TaxID=34028 RepID=UPI002FC6B081